ncbi:hypothetical protein KC19_2G153200 [Ceratodon purpureus]|uniref:Uncharacterized protein n=1 Tax=Ceratodon purpureus TaxID=3225 RepID=A0A8T0IX19_CERPU|nr:hypothetical protein KC19_2G153200 [Ceratodon purpureus]
MSSPGPCKPHNSRLAPRQPAATLSSPSSPVQKPTLAHAPPLPIPPDGLLKNTTPPSTRDAGQTYPARSNRSSDRFEHAHSKTSHVYLQTTQTSYPNTLLPPT